jgi:hypothetical protein
MMSYTTSAVWSHPVSSLCYTEHGQRCAVVLSGRITTVDMFRSGQLGLRCTVESNYNGLSARLAGASVTRDRALDTCEPSYMLGEARSGAEEHMTASNLSSRGGRARSHETCGSVGAYLSREARSRVEEHVATPKLNLASRRGLGPQATWRHQSSPQQGGEVRGRGTRGDSGAHLCREVWSKATVKDRRGDQRGVEWKPIKIPHRNLTYIPKSIRHPSLLTRLRPHIYSKSIGLQNWVRNHSGNTKQRKQDHV